ncbi:MAG: hypothetical protein PHQ86_06705 [Dehalococcoidales bacterium]|nr:hypothetical protein [Dehalococcoidales bacterium]
MRRYELGIKGKVGTFLVLFAMWFVLTFPLSKILDINRVLNTATFFGMLTIPALCLGFFTEGAHVIIIPPLAYLLHRIIFYAISGYNATSSDLSVFALVIVHLALCGAMLVVFLLGRGLRNTYSLCSKMFGNS